MAMDQALLPQSSSTSDPELASVRRTRGHASASVRDSSKEKVHTCGFIDRYHYAVDSFNVLDWDVFHTGAGAKPFRGFWCSHRGKRYGQNCPCETKCTDIVFFGLIFAQFYLAIHLKSSSHDECPGAGHIVALALMTVLTTVMILDAAIVMCINYWKLVSMSREEELPLIPIAAETVRMGKFGGRNMFLTFTASCAVESESLSVRQKEIIYSRLRASGSAELTVMVHDKGWYNNNVSHPQFYVCLAFVALGIAMTILVGTVGGLISNDCF